MKQFEIKYGLDEKPPLLKTLIFGIQWLAITIATVVIIGKVVAGLHFQDLEDSSSICRNSFYHGPDSVSANFVGHRMPLITGPATVLLVGIIAGANRDIDAIYTAIAAGGVFQVLLSVTACSRGSLFILHPGWWPPYLC